jgi:lactate racemase
VNSIALAYGDATLPLQLDDERFAPTIIAPTDHPALSDPRAEFIAAVRAPIGSATLRAIAKERTLTRVAIAISDHTRAVPDHLLVPWLVEEIGVADAAVTIIIGTGTHRGSTSAELERKLGAKTVARFKIVNHDCRADVVHVGNSTCGGECWLNRHWVDADLRIATGFIEPHFMAGFSGGSKAVVPGIAGLKTIEHFHRAWLIAHPNSTWGDIRANPLQALSREMVRLCPANFIVNVTLNRDKAITGIFAGASDAAHDAGCARAHRESVSRVQRRFPVVVTTNSGYPLDQNFYQTVKGISAASRIVEPGGTIIAASECRVGLPAEGEFRHILGDPRPSDQLLDEILASTHTRHDQWQVQILLQCMRTARVVLYSSLNAEDRKLTRTEHTADLATTLDTIQRPRGARLPIAIMPMGPLTIPVLEATAR